MSASSRHAQVCGRHHISRGRSRRRAHAEGRPRTRSPYTSGPPSVRQPVTAAAWISAACPWARLRLSLAVPSQADTLRVPRGVAGEGQAPNFTCGARGELATRQRVISADATSTSRLVMRSAAASFHLGLLQPSTLGKRRRAIGRGIARSAVAGSQPGIYRSGTQRSHLLPRGSGRQQRALCDKRRRNRSAARRRKSGRLPLFQVEP